MKTVMVTEIGTKAELAEIEIPQIDDNSVLIKTYFSGVSVGTEMWIATGRRLEGRKVPFPAAGYQVTGEIVETGRNVDGIKQGDMVAAFCSNAHSQYVKASKDLTHVLRSKSKLKESALFVMPCVGAHALKHARVETGENVLIVGQGLIGQCTAQLARLRGAYVVASEVSPERIAISQKYCADFVINARQGKLPDLIKPICPEGFDVVIESTGFEKLLEDAICCVKGGGLNQGGRFVFEGWYPDSISYNFHMAHSRQISCYYPCFIGPKADREGVLRLIDAGKIDILPLISHVIPWQKAAEVYTRLFTKERDHFNGIVFDWTVR